MEKDDLKVLMHLRRDARIKLADIARQVDLPITTVHDKVRRLGSVITKHSTLVDFSFLHPVRVNAVVRKKGISHPAVNSAFRIEGRNHVKTQMVFVY